MLELFEDLNEIRRIDIFKDEKDYWCIGQITEKDVLHFLNVTASKHIHYFSDNSARTPPTKVEGRDSPK